MSKRILYEQADYPVFQNRMYPTAHSARDCRRGTIRLVESLDTGLVYNDAFDPAALAYDSDYQNEQGLSRSFLEHLQHVRSIVLDRLGSSDLVEVGCGKAFFLEMLQEAGAEITGYDATYEGSNPAVEKRYLTRETPIDAKGIVLRHVLEHVEDPSTFLAEIAAINGGKGLIYIEVPCLDWILDNRAWFDIYYEHVNYFRLSDFARMFGNVHDSGRLFGGQYLYAVADLSTVRRPSIDMSDRVAFPTDFTAGIADCVDATPDAPTIVWGGASKGVIFSLLAQRSGKTIDRVIDINPAKQGQFLAGTGLRVMSPEEGLAGVPDGAAIYVMNPNYLDEIRAATGGRYSYIGIGNG